MYVGGIPAGTRYVLLEEFTTLEDSGNKVGKSEENKQDENPPNLREVFTQRLCGDLYLRFHVFIFNYPCK